MDSRRSRDRPAPAGHGKPKFSIPGVHPLVVCAMYAVPRDRPGSWLPSLRQELPHMRGEDGPESDGHIILKVLLKGEISFGDPESPIPLN